MDYFKGRTDVYAEKYVQKDGKKGYAKVCKNRFSILCDFKKYKQCKECPNETYIPLYENAYFKHLQGKTSLGIYPIVECKYTFFLAIDFDGEKFKEANRPDGSIIPTRYSRHYYDLYMLGKSSYKDLALNDKDLLEAVIHFKQKFYRETWMDYSDILANGIRLVPDDYRFKDLKDDYNKMKEMIQTLIPFDEIMDYLKILEKEINDLL